MLDVEKNNYSLYTSFLPLLLVALLQIYCTLALVCMVDVLCNRFNMQLEMFKSACTNFAYTSFRMFFHILLFFG